ncbi:MAG: hypothetical protein ACJ75B_22465 [Flavisolibacter sp.]
MKSIADYPASLKIGDTDDPLKFIIMTRKIWDFADTAFNAANNSFTKVGATN